MILSIFSPGKHVQIVLYLYCIYLPFIIKMYLHIYKSVKSRIDKNDDVCDEKYITAYTNLVYH